MKQFQTEYTTEQAFSDWLRELCREDVSAGLTDRAKVFHIFTDSCDGSRLVPVLRCLDETFPEVPYACCTGNGGIVHGDSAAEHIVVTATFYEDPDTKCEVLQLPVTHEVQEDSAEKFLQIIRERPWVKSVEMMTTIGNADIPTFCRRISEIPEEIRFFGGGALATDVHDGTASETFVCSRGEEPSTLSAVFVLSGGPQLHVRTQYLTGWRRLGLPFEVTACENNILKELDHVPALEMYNRFLEVPKNEHFFDMAVVFPFCFETDGVPYLRVSTDFFEDGSLVLGADIQEHTFGNIAYGDQVHILNSVNETLKEIQAFSPQAIRLFSCASRQFYWGADVRRETMPFEKIAPTSGFYTSGEFLRASSGEHQILLHNVTIVVAAVREGEAAGAGTVEARMEEADFSRQNAINNCLTTFINAATDQLRDANERLSLMAVTDGLTGLFNRTETERKIGVALDRYREASGERSAPVLLMLDLDYFKEINDTYGHQEGDEVLRQVAAIFRKCVRKQDLDASVGRWGGEEFMILLPNADIAQAGQLAEEIRSAFAEKEFKVSGRHTLSVGLTRAIPSDTVDSLTLRVDQGLYQAKEQGRNKSVIL